MMLARLEETLNRNIAESRKARKLCRQLDGRVLAVDVQGTSLKVFLVATEGSVRLNRSYDGNPDARLAATPVSLLALAGPASERGLRGGAIHIEGDAEVAQRFRDLLKQAQPDFEEELARIVGDVAARQMANFARGVFNWGRRTAESMGTNVAEFLQEEGRDVPTPVEVDEFIEAVDRLRDDADRLEARLSRVLAARSPAR
jgi:ubiquinone biosynthesis accessory factor UbiJ